MKDVRRQVALAAVLALGAWSAWAQKNPFSADVAAVTNDPASLRVTYHVPPGHYVYADRLGASVGGADLRPLTFPLPKNHMDELLGETAAIYDTDVSYVYSLPDGVRPPLTVTVAYQGCSKDPALCFAPGTETFTLGPGGAPVVRGGDLPGSEPTPPAAGAGGFEIRGRASGYLKPDAFLAFLDRVEAGKGSAEDALQTALRERGIWVALALILVFGAALNLTPCVLPMIPINLAIIGAGAQAGSRWRGFALGSAYGLAMALVYGALGLAVVLAGVKFGALNASPVFNLAIAALFFALALAMFDVIHIDLSRFQPGGAAGGPRRGGFGPAFAMGAVAALLAGACVAPVVISVLLLSTDLYARGVRAGLLLPFVLGVGMALPWPLAGAGLSFLPKPGRWMQAVKIGFGVVIAGFALWYGRLGVSLLRDRAPGSMETVAMSREEQIESGGWLTSLPEAMDEAARSGQPVLIDFWATWCKNCLYMDKTTFRDPAVTNRLARYVKVKFQAEDIQAESTRAVLDRFGVVGLPTYVVLTAERKPSGATGRP